MTFGDFFFEKIKGRKNRDFYTEMFLRPGESLTAKIQSKFVSMYK